MESHERLKFLRKSILKISQKEFGESLGLKPNSISDLENKKSIITQATFKNICHEYNVNYQWLLHGTGEIFLTKEHPSQAVPSFISDFYSLSEEGQKEITKYITAIIAAKKKEEED